MQSEQQLARISPDSPVPTDAFESPPYGGQYAGPWAQQPHPLHQFLRVLRKRKWTVATVLVVFTTLVAIATFKATPQFEATARIAYFREDADQLGFKDVGLASSGGDDFDYRVALDTQAGIIQSDTIALQVIKNLQLDSNPVFVARTRARTPPPVVAEGPAQMDPEFEAQLLEAFRDSLRVQSVRNTRVMEVSFLSPDPRLSAEIVNNLIRTYIEHNFRTKYAATMQASEWLAAQIADLQLKVETSQEKLVRYQKENEILGIDDKQNIVTSRLDQLNRELTAAESDRIRKEADYALTRTGNLESLPVLSQNVLVQRLVEQHASLQKEYAEATTRLGPAFPRVVELENQIKQVRASLDAETARVAQRIESEYHAALNRERMLRGVLEKQKQEANRLNQSSVQYEILKREAESNRQLYEGLLQRLKEAGVSAGLKSGNIRIIDAARIPIEPAKPNVPRNLALGFLLGLFGGIAAAFLRESLDTKVRNPEELEALTGMPALGIIPSSGKLASAAKLRLPGRNGAPVASNGASAGLMSHVQPKSEMAESYRALRTSLLLSSAGAPPRVILLTSSLPQEGKTTTAINTAIVLAQRNARVLLVDADLRRPSIHHVLALSNRTGLSSVLSGNTAWDQAIVSYTEVPGLDVLPAGPVPPHPAELLGGKTMRDCLEMWKQRYEHVLIDTPPVLSVTDAVLLSVLADAVVMVVRSGETPKEALRRSHELLARVKARIMGAVANAVDLQSADYYQSYYYGSKYGRYYGEDYRE